MPTNPVYPKCQLLIASRSQAGKPTATKFGNKRIMERDRLQELVNTYDGRGGRARRLL